MGIRHMSGSPWHLERYTREDGDDRRHKHRCVHYRVSENHCRYFNERCRGSAHCPRYKEYIPDDESTSRTVIDQKQCKFYNLSKNYCKYYSTICSGSSLCDHFQVDNNKPQSHKNHEQAKVRTPRFIQHYFQLEERVQHVKHGKGTVISFEDDLVIVRFDNGTVKELDEAYCLKNHLLEKILK